MQDLQVDKKFIIEFKFKDKKTGQYKITQFIKYEGLLHYAHEIGLKSISVDLIQIPNKENGNTSICRATVTSNKDQMFTDIGDANSLNVDALIGKHMIRMSSTRAIARALRLFTNMGMTCYEEIDGSQYNGKTGANDNISVTVKDLRKIIKGFDKAKIELTWAALYDPDKNPGKDLLQYRKDNGITVDGCQMFIDKHIELNGEDV